MLSETEEIVQLSNFIL